jgi:hypothetical protein
LATQPGHGSKGSFYATNGDQTVLAWDSGATNISYIAMRDDKYLAAYDSAGTQMWATAVGGTGGTGSPPSSTVQQMSPGQVLPNNGQAFIATGSYSATTYNASAAMGATAPALLTSSQLNTYCQNPDNSGTAKISYVTPDSIDGHHIKALYDPAAQQGSFVLVQNRPDPQDRTQNIRNGVRKEVIQRETQGPVERLPNGPQVDKRIDGPAADHRVIEEKISNSKSKKGLGKLVHYKGPITLKSNQFYVAKLPGLKVHKIEVKSNNLSNYIGFAPEPGIGVELVEKKEIHLHPGKTFKTSVKPGL